MVAAVSRRPTSPESCSSSSQALEFSVTLSSTAPTASAHYETVCWGCGLRLVLSSYAPIFKCGWCGAITNQNVKVYERKSMLWRHIRDRCFVSILLVFMVFIIGGGVWAVYPVLFSISFLCGVFHCTITAILSLFTVSMFAFASFGDAGTPPTIVWGSYPAVGKDALDNYTFCQHCTKPKSPRTHHCRSCGSCVLDMDHHCPFIGNCVGAANHRYFINFLILAVISMTYVVFMSIYAGLRILPPSTITAGQLHEVSNAMGLISFMRQRLLAFFSSATFLSVRGFVLVYLFVASISVEVGLSILLWQQLCYIYQGKTYLSHLKSEGEDEVMKRDCKNLYRFFGPLSASRYLPSCCNSEKNSQKIV